VAWLLERVCDGWEWAHSPPHEEGNCHRVRIHYMLKSNIRSILQRYAAAFLSVLAALLITLAAKSLFSTTSYGLFLCAVMFSAWRGGLLPGLVATLLSVLALDYYFIPPFLSLDLTSEELIHLVVFVAVALFITYLNSKQVRTEEALRKSRDDLEAEVQERTTRLHQLSGRLLHLQDEERRRIARELHETIAQSLVVLKMDLSVLSKSKQLLPAPAQEALHEAGALAQECMRQARTLSYLLHPPLLDEAGLYSALRWYVDGFARRSGIDTELQMPSDIGRLSQEVETTVFRIVQECLTNIHRHSGSPTAKVRIARTLKDVVLEVQDEGRGMPETAFGPTSNSGPTLGVGIAGIRERVQELGGHLEIKSQNRGTTVKVVLLTREEAA
jgi:signal transduction histidine kinase